jgi:hypothetical protein
MIVVITQMKKAVTVTIYATLSQKIYAIGEIVVIGA